jgi:hypothetical protein
MTKSAAGHRLEDGAVRVMYFFNTMDTFLPASAAFYLVLWRIAARFPGAASARLFPAFAPRLPAALLLAALLYLLLRAADFHPLLVPFCVTGLAWLLASRSPGGAGVHLLWMFALTSAVQIVFMGCPMALAARSPMIPLRMYLNSFVIIAPTTLSLPLTILYQLFIVTAATTLDPFRDLASLVFLLALLAAALFVRRFRKRGFIPETRHTVSPAPFCRRAMLLNIDGLSQRAFDSVSPPFLKALEKESAAAAGGAYTVYRALTNPAFASILTGAEPARHGVLNNNSGREIRVQALPDIVPARLYGSMHVRHFSRPSWAVTVVSLVERGYRNADAWLLGRLRDDLLRHRDDVRLWVVDLSEVDYCGHAWGSYSRQMKEALRHLDRLLEEFFGWLRENGLFDDTLFVVSSDHGLHIGEHSFILHPAEERVPLLFAGKPVQPQRLPGKMSIIDIAANISYALQAPYCSSSRGRVSPEIFAPPRASILSSAAPARCVGDAAAEARS